jgi:rod shape determining protein RodA
MIGLLGIFSATNNNPAAHGAFQKQFIMALVALVVFLFAYFLPVRLYKSIAMPSYILSLIILIAVLVMGRTVYGAKSWINLGPIGFQPSEFAKIGFIFMLSHLLTRDRRNPNNLKDFIILLIYSLIPIVLILIEPDMGTVIVYIFILIAILFWSGIDLFFVFVTLSPVVVLFASFFGVAAFLLAMIIVFVLLLYFKRNIFINVSIVIMNMAGAYLFDYAFQFLKPHQQKRIETFINPTSDPLGAGYNILQAQLAIGSGGFMGKGFLKGNQTQLSFIPKQWTDFIFSVIGEEFGFIGSVLIVLLFVIILVRLLNIASQINDKFESLVVIGILTLLLTHFTINIGMNLGVAPVVGIPLPFLSYGGSSLIINMFLLGVALNFYKNRREHT